MQEIKQNTTTTKQAKHNKYTVAVRIRAPLSNSN